MAYISWTPIFSAAIIGVGLNFLLNLFALSLGLSSFAIAASGKTYFSFAGFVCFCVSSLIAMFCTGWIAGKLSIPTFQQRIWGAFIGFLAWSLLLIMTIILLMNMIQYVAFHSNFTANLVAVKIANNAPMLTETIAELAEKSPLSINIETTKKVLTLNALLTFLLFFIGALASLLGGYLAYGKPPKFVRHS